MEARGQEEATFYFSKCYVIPRASTEALALLGMPPGYTVKGEWSTENLSFEGRESAQRPRCLHLRALTDHNPISSHTR